MANQTEGGDRPPIDFKEELRRQYRERMFEHQGDWSRAMNDARIADDRVKFYERAIHELDHHNNVIA